MLPIVSDEQTDHCFNISADIQGRVQALVSALTVTATTGGAPNGTAQPRAAVGSGSIQSKHTKSIQSTNKSIHLSQIR